jgi:hypothetical protein
MAYGYEQTTPVIRNAVRVLGLRLVRSGHLAAADDIMHLRLHEIGQIVAGGPLPPRGIVDDRRLALGRRHDHRPRPPSPPAAYEDWPPRPEPAPGPPA